MKRRLAAALCAVLLTVQILALPAQSAKSVYFVAAEENVLPLSNATMPFWDGAYLYISASIFSGAARESLGISQAYNAASGVVVLYGGGQSLIFELANNYAEDPDGNTYYPGARLRGGAPFVPASVVASFFGLESSLIKVEKGYLLWLRHPGFSLSEERFADAATYSMNNRYNDYIRSQEPAPSVTPTPAEPTDPATPVTPVTPPVQPPTPVVPEQEIALILTADENASSLMDLLDREGARAAFLCDGAFVNANGALLRRMVMSGYGVVLLANGADEERSVTEQLDAANEALSRATFAKTRLAVVENAVEGDASALEEQGYLRIVPDIDREQGSLAESSQAETLLRQIAKQRPGAVICADKVSAAGLRTLLQSGAVRSIPVRETP